MKKIDFQSIQWPTAEELEAELRREKKRCRRRFLLKAIALTLTVVVAAALAAAFLWMPVMRISGNSMAPTLKDGEIVAAYADSEIQRGDIIAFYYNNKLLVKRVIATGGDTVNIDALGNVTVNGERLEEAYVTSRVRGECDVSMPYTVPEGYCFVMGDRRSESLDSRSAAIGCVAEEQILGRVFAQVWPLDEVRWIGRDIWSEILN